MNNTEPKRPHTPLTLIILDGWGYSENPQNNAIYAANKPVWDELWRTAPHTLIHGSGSQVGLPDGQMGNSEVGHLNLGAGRVVYQEFTRIEKAIKDQEFNNNKVLCQALDQAKTGNKAVHIMGLLSAGGVHSHENQIQAMVKLAASRGPEDLYVHAFLDGRDTPPKSAADSISAMQTLLDQLGKGRFASIIGRYYAMDRDNRWSRVQAAYDLIVDGTADVHAETAMAALHAAYERDETDEFVTASCIIPPGQAPHRVNDGDVVIFMNFRADRARQLTQAFIDSEFDGFNRQRWPQLGQFVCLTEYKKTFTAAVAYPPERLNQVFGEYIANNGLRQLRIAETEKYAHVTFFFNGGEEQSFTGEDRILIPSPRVATYDLKPEMHAPEMTDKLVEAISSQQYDVIICNFANPDMVGHTGKIEATVKAIETVDQCLGRILAASREVGGECLITADHGNAEQLRDPLTDQPHTAHTANEVPFIYVGRQATLAATGSLSDVAPTMLQLLGLAKPAEMTGHSLISLHEDKAA